MRGSRARWAAVLIGETIAVGVIVLLSVELVAWSAMLTDLVRTAGRRLPFAVVALAAGCFVVERFRPAVWARAVVVVERVPASVRRVVVASGALLLCVVPLLWVWAEGETNANRIGGLLPWADATAYFEGTARLLHHGVLDAFNERRPLNAALGSVRLGLTDADFQASLVLQAVLFGGCMLLAARAIGREMGWSAGFLVFASTALVASRWGLDLAMSEPLGLTFGALAVALLWPGVRGRATGVTAAGLAALSLGLFARAGPLFMLLSVAVWAAIAFRSSLRGRALTLVACGLSAAAGLVAGQALFIAYGEGANNANGNFAVTLYGLAHGGKGGYTQFFDDYPKVSHAGDEQRTFALAYEKAFEQIKRHPDELVVGIGRAYRLFLDEVATGATLAPLPRVARVVAVPIAWAGGVFLVVRFFRGRRRRRPHGAFLVAAGAGFVASVPFIFPDGGVRTFSAAMPLVIAGVVWFLHESTTSREHEPSHDDERLGGLQVEWPLPASMLATLAALALVGPAILGALEPTLPDRVASCQGEERDLVVELGPGAPHIDLHQRGRSFVPDLTINRFHAAYRPADPAWISISDVLLAIEAPATIALVPAEGGAGAHHSVFLVGDRRLVGGSRRWATVCARATAHDFVFVEARPVAITPF